MPDSPLAHAPRTREGGFTLVEVLIALTVFAVMAVAFAAIAAATLRAYSVARARTAAEEAATAQLEDARRLAYDQLGTVGGNPAGPIPPSQSVSVGGFEFTLAVRVAFVDDPIPGGFQTAANYKSVRVAVSWNGSQLTTLESRIAPPREPSRDKAVMKIRVVDYAINQPVSGASVQLTGGPGGTRTDTSDVNGAVTFAALDPNNGSYPYTTVSVTAPGYQVFPDDLSPSSAARFQLTSGQLVNTVIRVYKPATLDVKLVDATGLPFAGPATVEVSSTRGRAAVAVVGGATLITTVGSEQVISGLSYTVSATAPGFAAAAVTRVVPTTYPTDLVSRYVFTMTPVTTAPLQVRVQDATALTPLSGIGVEATGGPAATQVGCTTDVTGSCVLNVPAGSSPNYTVRTIASGGRTPAQQTVSVPGPLPASITLNM